MKLLKGYRGKPAGDVEAAIDAVMAIAKFADAHRDRLVELDVNPLMVLPEGQGADGRGCADRHGGGVDVRRPAHLSLLPRLAAGDGRRGSRP